MRILCVALFASLCAMPVWANARITILMDVLRMTEVVNILREEGLTYGRALDRDMLDGSGGEFWQAQVDQIYNTQQISERVRQSLELQLNDVALEAAIDFFASSTGSKVIQLENTARRAMADPDIERAARVFYIVQAENDDPLAQSVTRFVAENDLLERNISGAMSANYQFYKGLADGNYSDQSDGDILNEIWSQQDDIRTDTKGWLNGFLLMAYQPLMLDEMEDYITYSASPEGRALNAALFEGFEAVYRDVSYALGRAVALNATGDEI
ncbi:MAG: hypothetical protein ABJQ70_15560 [Roseobacter sp.]